MLYSVERFLPQLRDKITLVYPVQDALVIQEALGSLNNSVTHFFVLETRASPKFGYDEQQFNKLIADHFVDSPLIMHLDSDCVFIRNISEADLLDVNTTKPHYIIMPYSFFTQTEPFRWRAGVAFWLGLEKEPEYDFMCRFPFVVPRELYEIVRRRITQTHCGLGITEVFRQPCYLEEMRQRGVQLSEYNLLGAVAWEWHRDEFFSWIRCEPPDCPVVPALLKQFLSRDYHPKQNQTDDLAVVIDTVFCDAMQLPRNCYQKSKYYRETKREKIGFS